MKSGGPKKGLEFRLGASESKFSFNEIVYREDVGKNM